MHEDGRKLLNLMFKPTECVAVSNSKFGYHSIPLENALNGKVTLLSPPDGNRTTEELISYCDSSELTLVSLSPMQGYRRDSSATAYRNFLVELDVGDIASQQEYIRRSGMPYSAMVFSGSKSCHTLISLDTDLPNEAAYRKVAQWILNILPLSDQNLKNPSRQIRIPGAEREPGKLQKLLEFKGKVSFVELSDWLKKHPECKPKDRKKRETNGTGDITAVPTWVAKLLKDAKNGFPNHLGRNKNWYILSKEFKHAGFDQDKVEEIFQQYFEEESDFKEKEWLRTIRSAFESED